MIDYEALIEDYKKYDLKRKNFYAEKMQRLGELESFMEELEESDNDEVKALALTVKKLRDKLTGQRAALSGLQKRLNDMFSEKYGESISSYKTKYENLRRDYDILLSRYFTLQRSIETEK